ncbi:MAG: hypothetical protein K8W52_24430 [Deltaproteobacteria bacterium]|nr:hypothetical protein [Deltaproteobacteria bacterium]
MKKLALVVLAACGSRPVSAPVLPADPAARGQAAWATPAGWKSETIPFPIEFAPLLLHRGVEELRFAPGMFDPAKPGYWSYAFVWRVEDPTVLDAPALARELTGYYQGLIAAVDTKERITARDEIVVRAEPDGAAFTLTAHIFDAFTTARPLDLTGWAARTPCGDGALWVFVLAPPTSPVRAELDALAHAATCAQP